MPFKALLITVSVPLVGPTIEGLKVTTTVQAAPGASSPMQFWEAVNSALAETSLITIDAAAFLGLDSVISAELFVELCPTII